MLTNSGENGHPFLVHDLRRNAFSFSPLRIMFAVGLSYGLCYVEVAAMKLKDAYCLEKSYHQPRQHIKKQRHYFVNKGPSCQSYGFSSSHV